MIVLSYTPGAIAVLEGRNDTHMNLLRWLFEAQIPLAGSVLILREVLGNIFGLASALGGMRRRVWAATRTRLLTDPLADVAVWA
jgi:nicotinamide mononucleotide transporter